MLAYVTFVNNKLFVDTINHNSRAIGEHSKGLSFFIWIYLKMLYMEKTKINRFVSDILT